MMCALCLSPIMVVALSETSVDETVETTSEVITTPVETTLEEPTTKPVTTTATTTEVKSTTTFKVTAYCACVKCCGKSDGITASGTKATQGRTIAVDPRYYPYGTEIILNGKTYIAEDCGGAIKGNRIDLYFDSHQDALEWGVRYIEGVVV